MRAQLVLRQQGFQLIRRQRCADGADDLQFPQHFAAYRSDRGAQGFDLSALDNVVRALLRLGLGQRSGSDQGCRQQQLSGEDGLWLVAFHRTRGLCVGDASELQLPCPMPVREYEKHNWLGPTPEWRLPRAAAGEKPAVAPQRPALPPTLGPDDRRQRRFRRLRNRNNGVPVRKSGAFSSRFSRRLPRTAPAARA